MWKDIKNYEGHYQINEYGDVRSIKFSREKIISPYVTCNGYCQVTLIKNGKKKDRNGPIFCFAYLSSLTFAALPVLSFK